MTTLSATGCMIDVNAMKPGTGLVTLTLMISQEEFQTGLTSIGAITVVGVAKTK